LRDIPAFLQANRIIGAKTCTESAFIPELSCKNEGYNVVIYLAIVQNNSLFGIFRVPQPFSMITQTPVLKIRKYTRKQIPDAVYDKLATMSEINQQAFLSEFKRRSKSPNLACLLWLFFGLHYAYVGKWWVQILFWMTMGGFFIWWAIDLFRLHSLIREHNKTLALTVLRDIQVLA
jgi:hypothetical protein